MNHDLNDQLEFEKQIADLSAEKLAQWTAREVYFTSKKLNLFDKRMGDLETNCKKATQAGLCTNGSVFTPKGKKVAFWAGIPSGTVLMAYTIIEIVKALKG